MAVSRRMFLHKGVLAAAACAATPLSALGSKRPIGGDEQNRESPSRPASGSGSWQDHASALDHLGRAQFTNAIGTDFKVTVEGSTQPVWVTLIAVNDLPALAPVNTASFAAPNKQSGFTPSTTGFILRFSSSAHLPQGTYLFQHDAMGLFALFTVPQGNNQGTYVATVNRLDQIVAVPFATSPARSTGQTANAPAAPATSSATETLPRVSSESPAFRRAAVRD